MVAQGRIRDTDEVLQGAIAAPGFWTCDQEFQDSHAPCMTECISDLRNTICVMIDHFANPLAVIVSFQSKVNR